MSLLTVTSDDVARMTKSAFIDGPLTGRPSSRFWVLLVLAAVIATAGLIGDSVATVIGAMIVAPLMTPILGVALGIVLADHRHITRSLLFVVGGAIAVIVIAFLLSMLFAPPDAYATNSQVAARISPTLIDLVAALATGLVGAFALVRADIADTLPGVAIAISLVPPLAVTGMLLQVGRYADAGQSLLLFGTNVAAIIATGTAVLLAYRVRASALETGIHVGEFRRRSLVIVIGAILAVSVPLAYGTLSVAQDQILRSAATPLAQDWAGATGWTVTGVDTRNGTVFVTAIGARPEPDATPLRTSLNDAGYTDAPLAVVTVDGGGQACAAGGDVCVSAVSVAP